MVIYYNIMGPPSFMRSVDDRNVVMRNAQDMVLEPGGGGLTETALKGVISTSRKWGKVKINMNIVMAVY